MKGLFNLTLFAALIVGSTQSAFAQKAFKNDGGIALNGYDVVAYHTQNAALRGSINHSVKHGEATYYFSSADHKKAFEAAPANYLPKYGGYCAFAMAMKGAQVPSDPNTFKMHNGDLYLFFNDYYEGKPFNTIIPWNGDEASMVSKANGNWKKP